MPSNNTAIVLITGANTGLGLETVKALLRSEQQYHVLLSGRDIDKARQAAADVETEIQAGNEVTPLQLDVESDESIQAAHDLVAAKFGRIDVLINNAGASFDPLGTPSPGLTPRQAFTQTFSVNLTGVHLTTLALLPLLLMSRTPRLLFITSGASSLTDASTPNHPFGEPQAAGLPKTFPSCAYRTSKVALNLLMLQWHNAVTADGVKVWGVAPGLLATGLGGVKEMLEARGAQDPRVGGECVRGVVEGVGDGDVGRVVREYGDGRVLAW